MKLSCDPAERKDTSMSQSTISPELAQKIQEYQQTVTKEPDGPGKRIGKVGEFTFIAPLKLGGAEKFRNHLATSTVYGANFESSLGTVLDLGIVLFDYDTRLCFAATVHVYFL